LFRFAAGFSFVASVWGLGVSTKAKEGVAASSASSLCVSFVTRYFSFPVSASHVCCGEAESAAVAHAFFLSVKWASCTGECVGGSGAVMSRGCGSLLC
jgi:hypothetical protein